MSLTRTRSAHAKHITRRHSGQTKDMANDVCQIQAFGHFLQLLSAGGEETAEQPALFEYLHPSLPVLGTTAQSFKRASGPIRPARKPGIRVPMCFNPAVPLSPETTQARTRRIRAQGPIA
jgi:hypothetical protein